MPTITSIRRHLASLVVPPICVACRGSTSPDSLLCCACGSELNNMPLGEWWWVPGLPPGCLNETYATFPFDGIARDLVHALKFRSAPGVAEEMAELMIDRAGPHLQMPDAIIPVPAHPDRERERGYNQSLALARAWSKLCDGRPVVDCLTRVTHGPPQTSLSRVERLQLPADEMRINPEVRIPPSLLEEGESPGIVVLVDDVVTTGVTLEVCASVICERMSAEVKALTFASTSAQPGRQSLG